MRSFISMTLLFTAATFVGCAQEQDTTTSATSEEGTATTTVASINEHCPIMGGDVTDDGGRVDWNGQTVGFCCPSCIDKFEALSDDEKTAALAKAEEGHEGHDHGDHDHKDEGSATEAS